MRPVKLLNCKSITWSFEALESDIGMLPLNLLSESWIFCRLQIAMGRSKVWWYTYLKLIIGQIEDIQWWDIGNRSQDLTRPKVSGIFPSKAFHPKLRTLSLKRRSTSLSLRKIMFPISRDRADKTFGREVYAGYSLVLLGSLPQVMPTWLQKRRIIFHELNAPWGSWIIFALKASNASQSVSFPVTIAKYV